MTPKPKPKPTPKADAPAIARRMDSPKTAAARKTAPRSVMPTDQPVENKPAATVATPEVSPAKKAAPRRPTVKKKAAAPAEASPVSAVSHPGADEVKSAIASAEAAANATVESIPEKTKTDTAEQKPAVKKSVSTVKKTPREWVYTEQERSEELDALPSLKRTGTPLIAETPAVDASAPPPPIPAEPLEEPPAGAAIDRGAAIPEHYRMDRLIVMVRDPFWIHAYWELRGGLLERLRFQNSAEVIDHARWVLRVRTPQEPQNYLVDIDLGAGAWYLRVAPDTTYVVDLGYVDSNGVFNLVLPGREVRTPRAALSPVMDERWAILRDDLEKLLRATGSQAVLGLSPESVGGSQAVRRLPRSEQPRALSLFSGALAARQA